MQIEQATVALEGGDIVQLVLGQGQEQPLELVEHLAGLGVVRLESVLNVGVEVVEHLGLGACHLLGDFALELFLQVIEGVLYVLGGLAAVQDVGNRLLKVEPIFDLAEHFVAGAEDTLEQVELVLKEFEDALLGEVALVGEVHDNDVVLLAETVSTADALFHALRVPWEVVVDDHRAELEVDAFRRRLGGDHDRAFVAEVVHERLAPIGSKDAGDDVAALVLLEPGLIDRCRLRRVVLAVEQQ